MLFCSYVLLYGYKHIPIGTHNITFNRKPQYDAFPAPTDAQIRLLDTITNEQFGQLYAMVGFNDTDGLRRLHRLGRFVGDTRRHHIPGYNVDAARQDKLRQFSGLLHMIGEGDFIVLPVGGAVVDPSSIEREHSLYVPKWYGNFDVGTDLANDRETMRAYRHNNSPANSGESILMQWDKQGRIGAALIIGSGIVSKSGNYFDSVYIGDGAEILDSDVINCQVGTDTRIIDSVIEGIEARSGRKIVNNKRDMRGVMDIAVEAGPDWLITTARNFLG